MRTILYALICVIVFNFLSTSAKAGFFAKSDSFKYVGTVKNGEKSMPGVLLTLYVKNVQVLSKLTNKQGGFTFYFKHNELYTIELVKSGFYTEKIIIDTKVAADFLKKGGIDEAFDNVINIYESFPGVKADIFEKGPVFYFMYNANSGYFEKNAGKSKDAPINGVVTGINKEKTKIVTTELKNAKDFTAKNNLEDALQSYLRILEINPEHPEAGDKAKEIKKSLKKEGADNLYKKLIGEADNAFSGNKLKDAREGYTKAKRLKPEDVYANNRLFLIDSLIARNYSMNKGAYEKLKASGDQKIKDKDYPGAIKDFEAALLLQIDENYPNKRIKAAKDAIAAEEKAKTDAAKALDDKFLGLMKQGDGYMTKLDYANAMTMYKQALQIKAEDATALAQKDKAEKALLQVAVEKLRKQKEKNYTDTIALADNAFKQKDFKTAELHYNAAQLIKPDEKYPAQQLKEILKVTKPATVADKQVVETDTSLKEVDTKAKQPISGSIGSEINELINSIKELEKSKDPKVSKLYLDLSVVYQNDNKLDKALEFQNKALAKYKAAGDKKGTSVVLTQMASTYFDSGQYKLTVNCFKEAIALKKELGDVKGQADVLSDMGVALENVYQYDNAVEAYTEVLELSKKIGDKEAVVKVSSKLGNIYYEQNDYKAAAQMFKKALVSADIASDVKSKGKIVNSLGVVYYKMAKYDDAVGYYNQAIDLTNTSGDMKNLSLAFNNLGNINFDWHRLDKAIEYYEKSLKIKTELNFEEGIAVALYNIGNTYLELKNIDKATEYLTNCVSLSTKIGFREVSQQAYKALSKVYEQNKDFKNASAAYKSYVAIAGPGMPVEGQIAEVADMYEQDTRLVKTLRRELFRQKILAENESMMNKQREQEISVKNLEIKNQRSQATRTKILLIFTLLCLGFAGLVALQFFRRYKEKKTYSEVIGFQKQQITDSISYASRIQQAVLPPDELMKTMFSQSFIFNKPKDIVSGDYFYVTSINDKIFVAVADCTGHGVPGAFMSMLGISLIKEVINQTKSLSANEILNQLRDSLMKALHQTGREDEAKDGMDIALCIIEPNKKKLEYSGANNPCFIVRDSQLIELKADRMPIGIHPVLKPFTSHTIDIQPNDSIYLFSDGYRDQIGGENNKKFKTSNFNELLISISSMQAQEQVSVLETTHVDWKGDNEQTDDILILGITV